MLEITTSTTAAHARLAPGGTVECLLSETMTVAAPGITGLALRSGPVGGATIDGDAITFTLPGRYHFVVSTATLGLGDLYVMACEDACLARIPNGAAEDPNWKPQTNADGRKRRILRSLAAYGAFFDGTAASLINQPLQHYGA